MPKISRLGQYRLLRKIGEGGMGTVYEAVQESLGRGVAVKILPPRLMKNVEFVERFKREAKAAARLQHANIVTIFDTGQEQGVYFYSMELVEGSSLQAIVDEKGRLGVDESVGLIRQALQGLAYAWEQNVIHRDIKPDNLMLTSRRLLKIADFGLAKARMETESLGLTSTGSSMGTPYYMSPEQAANAKDVDHRADIYSLGATFYHLLTGRVPFAGSSPIEVAIKAATTEFEPVRKIRPEVPPGLAAVIERMLQRERVARFQTADALLSALELVQAPQTVGSARATQVAPSTAGKSSQGTAGALMTAKKPPPVRLGVPGLVKAKITGIVAGAVLVAVVLIYGLWSFSRPLTPEQRRQNGSKLYHDILNIYNNTSLTQKERWQRISALPVNDCDQNQIAYLRDLIKRANGLAEHAFARDQRLHFLHAYQRPPADVATVNNVTVYYVTIQSIQIKLSDGHFKELKGKTVFSHADPRITVELANKSGRFNSPRRFEYDRYEAESIDKDNFYCNGPLPFSFYCTTDNQSDYQSISFWVKDEDANFPIPDIGVYGPVEAFRTSGTRTLVISYADNRSFANGTEIIVTYTTQ